ncbi:electron transfer flavoprotein beta subunit [Fibrobacter sp. UWH5]|uniref:electron transfer flavoprotein subunit beta/FixA family protein n=1 Tax=Fibrobacter sp. UWH5 TaxID=1896211 RepID=UPI000913514D|nr:electron transfer flavoprotein subunit beta/FixA family protein [Fibrobacter sp. UWH5]SHK71083.1 electron transfer flavoprotein beta subunit [Fibrobacter sp. UWH5]
MSLKIVVLAKQVPDTRNVGPDAMTEQGTINRAALPAVFNPEDLNALEQALRLKDQFPGSTISVVTMGLPKSAEVVRESLYRGADEGFVVTDRTLGGADTLATSYTLAQAIKKVGNYDIILCGRQAIDGDTAQVGPQIAQKLGLTQVTYAEEILSLDEKARKVVIRRLIDGGVETVEAPLPLVVTVNGSAAPCRPRNAKRVMKYKNATAVAERAPEAAEKYAALIAEKPYLDIAQWGAADIEADPAQIGKAGSPTNVKAVKNIVFKAKESRTLTASDEDVEGLIKELLEGKIIG